MIHFRIKMLLDMLSKIGELKRRSDSLNMSQIESLHELYGKVLLNVNNFYQENLYQEIHIQRVITNSIGREQKSKELHVKTIIFATNEKTLEDVENIKNAFMSEYLSLKKYYITIII